MKNIPNQLSLFSEIEEEAFRKTANELIDLLNMDRKPKDCYVIQYYYKHKQFYVLIASNKDKNIVCNVVDENGKIPNGFDVCWRLHQFVLEELNVELV